MKSIHKSDWKAALQLTNKYCPIIDKLFRFTIIGEIVQLFRKCHPLPWHCALMYVSRCIYLWSLTHSLSFICTNYNPTQIPTYTDTLMCVMVRID